VQYHFFVCVSSRIYRVRMFDPILFIFTCERTQHLVSVSGTARESFRMTTHRSSLNLIVKQSRYTPWRRLRERRYSSYSFSTSALDGGEWSASRPGRALPPEKGPPVPIVQEAGWAPEPVWTKRLEEKSFAPCRGSNPDRPVVQPVVRHYTA
jgi:hypothetical protein